MKPIIYLIIGVLACLSTPVTFAQDQFAYTVSNSVLRTGPDLAYPPIMTVPRGSRLTIYGCLSDWRWCDVSWHGERGWIAGNLLEYDYAGRRVYIPDYGAQIGMPILIFGFDSYWNRHYRDRDWFRHRAHWRHIHMLSRPQQPQQRLPQQQRETGQLPHQPLQQPQPLPQQRLPQQQRETGQLPHQPLQQPQPLPQQRLPQQQHETGQLPHQPLQQPQPLPQQRLPQQQHEAGQLPHQPQQQPQPLPQQKPQRQQHPSQQQGPQQ
ncbi:SH3 domain-containing protein [Pseudomonas sp. efr-133-R2A-59]|uniref:SH3 domain-containing protein n=1 Tax=Pseudomonas sp. efr-133-R2A-59 TaxID=3040307 RepID=UPI00255728C2|nr:SH3 domain-containing protein [Pseudomonas sp. efr-133-R2A-59]